MRFRAHHKSCLVCSECLNLGEKMEPEEEERIFMRTAIGLLLFNEQQCVCLITISNGGTFVSLQIQSTILQIHILPGHILALIKPLFQKRESSCRLARQPAVSLCATTRCSCCCQEGHLSIIHRSSDLLQVLQFPRWMLGCSLDGDASKSNIKYKRSDQFQECSLNAWSQILEYGQIKHC